MILDIIGRSRDAISSVVGRVFLGLVAMATIVATLPLQEQLEFDLEKALGIALALAAWISAEWLSWDREPHPHDVELRRAIFALANPALPFLRDHDLGSSFQWSRLDGLIELQDEYVGVRFRFVDRALQREWKKVQDCLREFLYFTSVKSYPSRGGGGFNSFLTVQDQSGIILKETLENIARANKLATELYDRFEALEARSLIRLGAITTDGQR